MDMFLYFLPLLVPCMSYYRDYDTHYDNPYIISRKPLFKRPYRGVMETASERENEYQIRAPRYSQNSFSHWLRAKKRLQRIKMKVLGTKPPKNPTLIGVYFPPIMNRQIGATDAKDKYKWLARVVHSTGSTPYICSAACVDSRIFLTAARCVYQAKVALTSVWYMRVKLQVKAVVVPSQQTPQMFDDIGLIVVKKIDLNWSTIKLYPIKRTDNRYMWFEKLKELNGTVIGHVASEDDPKNEKLYELNININIYLCNWIYSPNPDLYFVPCYHSCSLQEHTQAYAKSPCRKYLAGEGHAVLEGKTQTLLGIATWAAYSHSGINMPVGMAVPNSKYFFEDLDCAKTIRAAADLNTSYTNMCPNKDQKE